ncbi:hypothetical protein AB0C22_30745 [Micromonospora sp. NPDC048894]|uniref:hypothetical protein n=1 Tax=Micromonospora sp. NPDC048894 TaxID=3155493 RepID=UPI0033CB42B5
MHIYSLAPGKDHINQAIRDGLGLDDTHTQGHWVIAAADENRAVGLLRERGFTDITEHDIIPDRSVKDLRSAALLDRETVLVQRLHRRDGDAVATVFLDGTPHRLGWMRLGRFVPDTDG